MERNDLFHFGPFCLDAQERVLLRAGRLVPLPPKALSTLLVLVRHIGHVVEKDVLMAEVWPDEDVEEGNLAQHIFMLRRVLGERRESPSYIETVPRRGYRFLNTPEPVADASNSSDNTSVAFQTFLDGSRHWSQYTREGLQRAIKYFRYAIELDSAYTPAYQALIDCYLRLATNYLTGIDAAPSLSGNIAFPNETLSDQIHTRIEWYRATSDRERRRALQLKSTYPTARQWHVAYAFACDLHRASVRQLKTETRTDAVPADSAALMLHVPPAISTQYAPLTADEEVQIFCLVARAQMQVGNHEAACAMLQPWWTFGAWPTLSGLSPQCSADLLLTAGAVAAYIASTRQVPRGQKHAEALLNGAIGICEQLGSRMLSAEGQIELTLCYQLEGMFDLARTTLETAFKMVPTEECELRTLALIRLAQVEWQTGRLQEVFAHLSEVAKSAALAGPLAVGRYHTELATALQSTAPPDSPAVNVEQALEHYQKSFDYFSAIGNIRYAAVAVNNKGYMALRLKRLDEAEIHLVHSRKLFEAIGDRRRCALVDLSLVEFYFAAGRLNLAKDTALRAIATLETSGHEAYFAQALRVYGDLLCKLDRRKEAKRVLNRAVQVSERCGDIEGAGDALLILIEEMSEQLDDDEKLEIAARLHRLLEHSQKDSTIARLQKCLNLVVTAA